MDEKELRNKELRNGIKQIEARLNGRIEMFNDEIDRTRKDFQKLSSLYDELAKLNDDPIFKRGCEITLLELRREIQHTYNGEIASKFKSFC